MKLNFEKSYVYLMVKFILLYLFSYYSYIISILNDIVLMEVILIFVLDHYLKYLKDILYYNTSLLFILVIIIKLIANLQLN
jgi:hypothetical protein